jgi:hypothetical protein
MSVFDYFVDFHDDVGMVSVDVSKAGFSFIEVDTSSQFCYR